MSRSLNRWWIWCLAALLIGLAMGWAAPPPPLPKEPPEPDNWSLSDNPIPGRTPSAEIRSALHAVRWDGEASGTAAAGPWRLAGVASGPVALIQTLNDKKILRLERGAPLPDDGTLVLIGADRIRIERGGCELVYQLYRTEPLSAEGENCPEPSSEATSAAAERPTGLGRGRAARR